MIAANTWSMTLHDNDTHYFPELRGFIAEDYNGIIEIGIVTLELVEAGHSLHTLITHHQISLDAPSSPIHKCITARIHLNALLINLIIRLKI